jgi:threonine synthase
MVLPNLQSICNLQSSMTWKGLIHHYRAYLPVTEATPVITLKEGNTPLIEATNLSRNLGANLRLYLKYEGLNPTGSFKDRGMTLAISKAVEAGKKVVMCASTGNTSASAAAYAAKAGLKCIVLIPNGEIALGKLAQALMHGAEALAIDGNFDEALELVRLITDKRPIQLVNSINPFRIEGQKTGAFEIVDQLGRVPDYHVMPVGNAGNITAYWKGYKEYRDGGVINTLPKMIGFQAEGAAPIVLGRPVENPQTVASAIKIGNPASWRSAEKACEESEGLIRTVSDEEILLAYRKLAKLEGLFVEPASAAAVAGAIKLNQEGYFPPEATVACVLTGHGLKDPDTAMQIGGEPIPVTATEPAIMEYIEKLHRRTEEV